MRISIEKKKWYFCMLCSLMFSYIKFIIVFYPFSFSSTGVRFFSLIYVKHKRIVSGKELKEDFFQGLLIFWLNIEKTVRFFKFWQKRGWTQRDYCSPSLAGCFSYLAFLRLISDYWQCIEDMNLILNNRDTYVSENLEIEEIKINLKCNQ